MDREQALDTALGQIERSFGKGAVMRMSDQAQVSVGAISTGSLALDLALGIGGLPRGRVVEIFGPESSGKTTLVYHVIAEAQRRGGIGAFIDAEHAMDPVYAKRIGVDIDELLVSQPDDSGPKISTTRPRGSPPIPSARSSASAPVGIASIPTWPRSPSFMIEPLPNCLSIWLSAISSALSRSTVNPSLVRSSALGEGRVLGP